MDAVLVFFVAFHEEAETHYGVFADIWVVFIVRAAVEDCFDTAEGSDLVLDVLVFPYERAEDENGKLLKIAPFKI